MNMDNTRFDTSLADSQATPVVPINPKDFDFEAYEVHAATLLEPCRTFRDAQSGVLVYRRMRVHEVFSYGCRDMRASLEWQLGALTRSLEFPADIPNFLEPWYGIGTIASAYGLTYEWLDGQAPMGRTLFKSAEDALALEPVPVRETAIGKHTLAMIDYFLDATDGRLPISVTDVQSPFNVACHIVDLEGLFMDIMINPEVVKALLNRIADLMIDFTHEQLTRIGERVVWPGHGFASSPVFQGMGMSDDNSLMVFPDHYVAVASEADARACAPFGGTVFHSCGNWTDRVDVVKRFPGLRAVDAAFTRATDPSPNAPEVFGNAFAGTGVVVNARMVGDVDIVADCVRRLWQPGLKLIAVTYCHSPEEQAEAWRRIHEICWES